MPTRRGRYTTNLVSGRTLASRSAPSLDRRFEGRCPRESASLLRLRLRLQTFQQRPPVGAAGGPDGYPDLLVAAVDLAVDDTQLRDRILPFDRSDQREQRQ